MAQDTIPVQVADDAAARVAELGLQRELEQMIEHARQTARGLRAIRVTLEYDPVYPANDPQVVVWVHRDVPPEGPAADKTGWQWAEWIARTFPPHVTLALCVMPTYGEPDGR
jgi:2'-5' RNA ligase